MTEQEYRNHPGVNKSALWEIRKSPKHYKWLLEHPSEDTPALRMGRAVHMAVLQPAEFAKNYVIAPGGIDRRTKDGKAAWAEFLETAGDREILTEEDHDVICEIARSVTQDARGLLCRSAREMPLFWDDPRTGIGCKCRMDGKKLTKDKLILFDLKTTEDASTDAFVRSAIKYGYHVQAAHYINGAVANRLNRGKPVEWWFIAVEKKPPYAVNLIKADQGFIDAGQAELSRLMDTLDRCMTFDEWPGYGESVLIMPAWAMREEE